jgi:hypothetical protein
MTDPADPEPPAVPAEPAAPAPDPSAGTGGADVGARPGAPPGSAPPASAPSASDPAGTPPASPPPASEPAGAPPASDPAGPTSPPLRADPDRPVDSGWREPPWIPGRPRGRDRRPSPAAIVVGLVLIGLGVYWFLDWTLGVAMPPIAWGSVWPVILIVIGGLIVVRSLDRRS